jgi:hypothetical protein
MESIDNVGMTPAFSDEATYRIKPKTSFVFFHTQALYKNCKPNSLTEVNNWIFSYPEYKPAGPHIMLELNSDKESINVTFSNSKTVNKQFTNEI